MNPDYSSIFLGIILYIQHSKSVLIVIVLQHCIYTDLDCVELSYNSNKQTEYQLVSFSYATCHGLP